MDAGQFKSFKDEFKTIDDAEKTQTEPGNLLTFDLGFGVTGVLQRGGDAYNRVCRIVIKNELKNQIIIIEWDQYLVLKANVTNIDKHLEKIGQYIKHIQAVEEAGLDEKNFFM